jgi:hypothetical protein
MTHPLYPVANRLVGRHVIAYHVNGRAYPGILHSVHHHGIYLIHTSPVSADTRELNASTLGDLNATEDVQPVYAPLGYFAFGALTGLTLGALASPYGYYW